MSDEPDARTKGPTKPCRFCSEDIPAGAVYCNECDQFQNWRRYMSFSTTMVALLTALVSVVATTWSNLPRPEPAPATRINAFFAGATRGTISGFLVVVSNTGNRAGAVSNFVLSIDGQKLGEDGQQLPDVNRVQLENSSQNDFLIRPNETETMEFILNRSRLYKQNFVPLTTNCTLEYVTTSYDGTRDAPSLEIDCGELNTFYHQSE